jgi:hypothetical protein
MFYCSGERGHNKGKEEMAVSKIVRYEFTGSWMFFWICWVTVIGIPVAILHLLTCTLRVETEMAEPERFISEYRAGRWHSA